MAHHNKNHLLTLLEDKAHSHEYSVIKKFMIVIIICFLSLNKRLTSEATARQSPVRGFEMTPPGGGLKILYFFDGFYILYL